MAYDPPVIILICQKSYSQKLSILNKSEFSLNIILRASKYQKLRKTIILSIKILKDTYVY